MPHEENKRVARWYFGGTGSALASLVTHPLDLIKVHCQTSDTQRTLVGRITKLYGEVGLPGLYNGISASLLRQLTYSMTRFGVYSELKRQLKPSGDTHFTFLEMMAMSGFSGCIGGIVGTPADMINVRMQNDVKLPPAQRRNYRHAFHGLYRVYTEEGIARLFSGLTFASLRATVMTIGQISIYDEVKLKLLDSDYFDDNVLLHFLSSVVAGGVATVITQPVDVLKTRQMNAKPGEFNSIFHVFVQTAKMGPSAFFKGIIPAFARLAPHTVLQFLILEQLRQNFGYLPTTAK